LEYNLSLSEDYKIHDGWTKWILRKAMIERMPAAIVWRKNKFGFEAPDELWQGYHRAEMEAAIFESSLIRELTDTKRLAARYRRLDARSQWRLYSVALWEKAFMVTA
jgi:asparagine synthase (glutamine-hydrolysing)